MAVFVALLLTMAVSRIFHSYFSILSNCLPLTCHGTCGSLSSSGQPLRAQLDGMLTSKATIKNGKVWCWKLGEEQQTTMRNTEENESDDIEMMNIIKQSIFPTKKTSWDGKYIFRWFFFFAGPPHRKTSFRPTPAKAIRNPLRTWILFRAEGTSRPKMISNQIIFQWGILFFSSMVKISKQHALLLACCSFSWMSCFPGLVLDYFLDVPHPN